MGAEEERAAGFGPLENGLRQAGPWSLWGPYVSERQWGTVREDVSADGDAWASFPHDHARSRAYRWGEDGLAGFCDVEQRRCLGLALWNGHGPILKERIFGLTGPEGNCGEDPEYELLETGVFDAGYWTVEVEFPLNYLICEALDRLHHFLGDQFRIEYPTGSGGQCTLAEAAADLRARLISVFLPGPDGRRPCDSSADRMPTDLAWREGITFSEYFHGDAGAGLGASHQTGWTGIVADVVRRRRRPHLGFASWIEKVPQ